MPSSSGSWERRCSDESLTCIMQRHPEKIFSFTQRIGISSAESQ
jgi:hypothetical protein